VNQDEKPPSAEILQAFLEHTPAIIFVKDLDGRYVEVNRTFEQLVQRSRSQTLGLTDAQIFPAHVAQRFRANDLEVVRQCRALDFEEPLDFIGGPSVSLTRKFPIADDTGRTVATAGMVDARAFARASGNPNDLTERQREILRLIAVGTSTKEIAYHLGVSAKTVESHRSAIMKRLGVRSVAGLVIYAVRNRLVDVDGPAG
jgi:DNA-binding CsgD family transcriptional regulator